MLFGSHVTMLPAGGGQRGIPQLICINGGHPHGGPRYARAGLLHAPSTCTAQRGRKKLERMRMACNNLGDARAMPT